MRQPQPFVISTSKSAQKGFSLFIVLMVMIVVAFLVVSVTQSYNTEQRISTNDADHKFAMALAEAALREGEKIIADEEELPEGLFTNECTNAFCSVGTDLERIDNYGRELQNRDGAKKPPKYIIEYISTQDDGSIIYRVTAKAWGKNGNTVVILQSYVAAG